MHVVVGDSRVSVRPTWRSFVLSLVTGSLYQLYWLVVVGRELSVLGWRTRTAPQVTMGIVAASQVTVLAIAAVEGTSTFGVLCALVALSVGAIAIFEVAESIGQLQDEQGLSSLVDRRIAAILFVVGCAVGAFGVLPADGIGPIDRVIGALSTGILLPFWLMYLQHQLNRALESMGPVSEDEELFGGSGSDVVTNLMRRRLGAWQRGRERTTEQDLLPWATFGLTALCTAVFLWQVLAFGLDLSLEDMRASGASTMELVRDGEAWRLLTQHVVHFTVDHWAFNMFALCVTGWIVERTIGHSRTIAVFGGSVIGATALAWWIGPGLYGPNAEVVVSGGESGIGFGMFGALLAIDRHGHTQTGRFGRMMCIFGAISSLAPGVGILAHAGGFIGGFVATRLLYRVSWELAPEAPVRAAAPAVSGDVPAPAVVAPPVHAPAVAQSAPPATPLPNVVAPSSLPPIDRRTG